jgi:hypothetical protein
MDLNMTVFVGDEPSRLNTNKDIAFVGSKSHPTFVSWVRRLKTELPMAYNSNTQDLLEKISYWYNRGAAVVALGNKASARLKKLGIEHFKLPHPSPRNRLLNNKKFIDLELRKCKNYLKGKGKCVYSAPNGNVND